MKCVLLALTALLILQGAALAEETLSARRSGNVLDIAWTAQGKCVLTVYRNGWPESVSYVDGVTGGKRIEIRDGGSYSVRLKTPLNCLTADADPHEAGTPAPSAKPTLVPDSKTTEVPSLKPTVAPTIKPTLVPTVLPTVIPAATPVVNVPSAAGLEGEVIAMVNAERARYGLQPLSVSAELSAAARVRAQEIAQLFSHTRPDGSGWSTVSSLAKGENIARGQSSAERVMAAWMTSDGHRANILRGSFGSIGVCALKVNGVIHWVQLFGR